jgi:hypothetical protein
MKRTYGTVKKEKKISVEAMTIAAPRILVWSPTTILTGLSGA